MEAYCHIPITNATASKSYSKRDVPNSFRNLVKFLINQITCYFFINLFLFFKLVLNYYF